MTPTEVSAILRQFNEWRRGGDIDQPGPLEIGEAIDAAIEMIERLEAAEAEALEEARLNGMGSEREAELRAKLEAAERSDAESIAMYRKARDERDALRIENDILRAKVAEMERQEPVAWMLNCQTLGGDTGWILSWTQSGAGLCNRLQGEENEKRLYALPCAQPESSVPDGWKLVPTEPTKEMRAAWDSSPICEDDDAEFRRAYSEMLAASPEAKP